jgi:hypothetical protein
MNGNIGRGVLDCASHAFSAGEGLRPPDHEKCRIPHLRLIVTGGFLLALASACGQRDAAFNPSHFTARGLLAPPEVAVPRGTRAGNYRGLFLMDANGGSQVCCWIAPETTLRVKKDRAAQVLMVAVYVPDVPLFRAHAQTLKVVFPGNPAEYVRGLAPGFHTARVRVPASLRRERGTLTVRLHAAVTYAVPGTPGAPGPRYAVILTSVYFV